MQKVKKTGLPEDMSMRHDKHYVDLISERDYSPRIRMIKVERIDPSPHQARSELGNIQELMASIQEKGILEPILVRKKDDRFEIIAGERRYMAAKSIGLGEVPCIEKNVSDNEAMELALVENMQRKDLDPFEEADGLKALSDQYGYNHEQIAKKIGKARSTITEIINLSKIPKDLRDLCIEFNIKSRGTLIEIAKQKNKNDMYKLITTVKQRDLKREDTRDLSKQIKGKGKKAEKYIYNYQKKDKSCRVKIEFRKANVSKEEIISILEEMIKKLKVRYF